jgi:hypothetical protein
MLSVRIHIHHGKHSPFLALPIVLFISLKGKQERGVAAFYFVEIKPQPGGK